MRCFEWLVVIAAQGCAVPLHDDGTTSAPADAAPPLPVASGCLPFQGVTERVTGAFRSASTPGDAGTVFVVDEAVIGGQDVPALTLASEESAAVSDCLASAATATPPESALPALLVPLAALSVAGAVSLFYDAVSTGYGVASLGEPGTTLWTSDRPAYGTAAVADDDMVYAFGCLPARFLDADCYVARAPIAGIASESAYEYYVGGGRWSPRVDDGWPMTSGGTAMDVGRMPSQSRWLMAYVPPLGSTILVRSGLAPEGPWSAPIPVATCDLADPDMFCAGLHMHPSVVAPAGSIAVSYAIASLSSDAATRQASEPAKWWPRLFAMSVPPLP